MDIKDYHFSLSEQGFVFTINVEIIILKLDDLKFLRFLQSLIKKMHLVKQSLIQVISIMNKFLKIYNKMSYNQKTIFNVCIRINNRFNLKRKLILNNYNTIAPKNIF